MSTLPATLERTVDAVQGRGDFYGLEECFDPAEHFPRRRSGGHKTTPKDTHPVRKEPDLPVSIWSPRFQDHCARYVRGLEGRVNPLQLEILRALVALQGQQETSHITAKDSDVTAITGRVKSTTARHFNHLKEHGLVTFLRPLARPRILTLNVPRLRHRPKE